MICSVCNIEKQDSEFQKYFHSTQNKWRTRKQCTPCLYSKRRKDKEMVKEIEIVQPVVPELQPEPIIDYSTNPDYYKCNACQEYKFVDEYYVTKLNKPTYYTCKECAVQQTRDEREEHRKNNCGSEFIPRNVGVYADQYQKACTFKLMELLGYLLDKETGIWIKPGVKEIRDGKPYFPNVVKRRAKGKRLNKKEQQRILDLRDKGLTYDEIALELKISDTTVYRYVKTR